MREKAEINQVEITMCHWQHPAAHVDVKNWARNMELYIVLSTEQAGNSLRPNIVPAYVLVVPVPFKEQQFGRPKETIEIVMCRSMGGYKNDPMQQVDWLRKEAERLFDAAYGFGNFEIMSPDTNRAGEKRDVEWNFKKHVCVGRIDVEFTRWFETFDQCCESAFSNK
jgi:hypothetical protein